MENIRGKFLIVNGNTADASDYTQESSADLYYEVIRVIKGKYLFLDDHLNRLRFSCSKRFSDCPGTDTIKSQLIRLAEISGINDGNVKLLVYHLEGESNIVCYFVPHHYPEAEDYILGVKVLTFEFVRPDPNVKRWNERFRLRVNQFIKEENIYEALLINEEGKLTEGSRSNLFFIDDKNRVITTPNDQVLQGITQKYVFQICHELGLTVIEQAISLKNVSNMTGCFITGTSPKVLPVSRIDDVHFNSKNPVIQEIVNSFNQLIQESTDL